jgi:ABC-2 type transport system ATP-binding protein
LKSQVGGDVLTVTVARPDKVADVTRLVGALPGAEPPQVVADRVIGRVPQGGAALIELVRGLDREGVTISGIESRRPSLDDVFLGLTGRSLRDAEAVPASAKGVAV